ncbi:MAG: FtsX-like permease family protein [Clostridium sp.]
MNNLLYPKLAITNIKKNSKMYVPYILTCICIISMYYVLVDLSFNKGILEMPGGFNIRQMLRVGVNVMSVLSLVFIFYTQSFLIKQRKKEFGLFNILGMEKRHISKVLFFENLYVSLGSLIVGIGFGMILNKLMFLLLMKILRFEVKMGIEFSREGFLYTIGLFILIFTVVLLNTIRQVYFTKTIELIKGGNIGEREPKNKWILTIIGLVSLGIGYYISVTTTNPMAAINLFFVAVIFVCLGTELLFTSGSITLLKILRKNKKYFYKTNNFISVSTMMYRMKRNAVGLANICILSTAVLVMLSTTVALYIGSEDILRTRYPRNITISIKEPTGEDINLVSKTSMNILETRGEAPIDLLDYKVNSILAEGNFDNFKIYNKLTPELSMSSNTRILNVILLEDYNRLLNESQSLMNDEVLIYSTRGEDVRETINIEGETFKVKENLDKGIESGIDSTIIFNTFYVVVKDNSVFNKILELQKEERVLDYYYAFDIKNNDENGVDIYNEIHGSLNGNERIVVDASAPQKNEFYSLYGGFFFLGMFLGLLFIMATVLIMYYKQLSEGYDDKERYNIMQKVGMSREEVKSTINSQVLKVFFTPLLFAIVHICFAFPVIKRLLAMLNFTNVKLYAISTALTVIVFGICYGMLYLVTSKVYYKIVK